MRFYLYDHLRNKVATVIKLNTYQKGDKLAQLVIVPILTPELQKVDEFSNETSRGQNGFGSTGI